MIAVTPILLWLALAAAPGAAATCRIKAEEIRDARGRLAGTLHTRADCTLEARDRTGRLVGRYDPRSRETRDGQGRLVSRGNTAAALILGAAGQAAPGAVPSKCRFCDSTSYGPCHRSPHRKHEHISDDKRCEFCGSPAYGQCLFSPTKRHRHGIGANRCRWCGSMGIGGGCVNSPSRVHER
jgi:hypothetical protein